MKQHCWGLAWALSSLSLLISCSSGKQVLAWEGDTYVPWHGGPAYFVKWPNNGPLSDPSFFPLSVWLQNPILNATKFQAAGVNFFTGLWMGPTSDQMDALNKAAMPVICGQTPTFVNDPAIKAWLMPDGPDNAQEQPDHSYGPCIPPSSILADYDQLTSTDSTRPVYLSLGRGVAEPNWVGRGACLGRVDMYPDYVKGGDILGFNDYVVNNGVALEYVAVGMDNLLEYSHRQKPVIAIIEASDYSGADRLKPEQVKTEVWMAIVHGAAGIEYYCHRMQPTLDETYCLDVLPIRDALIEINDALISLAPVLNTQSVANGVTVTSSDAAVPVDTMLKRYRGATYLFAVAMRASATTATFQLEGIPETASAEVLGEGRTIAVSGRAFRDAFAGYGVHRYRITY